MEQLKLQLDWKPNAQFAGPLLAHHLGWYEQAGLELTIGPGDMAANPVDALKQAGPMVASADDHLIIQARTGGQPVKAIAAMLQFSAFGWLVRQESAISSIADLRGKRVGVHGDGLLALDLSLARSGLSRTDVEILPLDFDYVDMLRSGRCDAVQGFVITESFEMEAAGLAIRTIPGYVWRSEPYAQVLVATDDLIKDGEDLLVKFLKVTFEGWRLAFEQPQETAQTITTYYLPESDPTLELKILQALRPFVVGRVGLNRLGWLNTTRWRQIITDLAMLGLANPHLSPEEVMTDQLIKRVYQA